MIQGSSSVAPYNYALLDLIAALSPGDFSKCILLRLRYFPHSCRITELIIAPAVRGASAPPSALESLLLIQPIFPNLSPGASPLPWFSAHRVCPEAQRPSSSPECIPRRERALLATKLMDPSRSSSTILGAPTVPDLNNSAHPAALALLNSPPSSLKQTIKSSLLHNFLAKRNLNS